MLKRNLKYNFVDKILSKMVHRTILWSLGKKMFAMVHNFKKFGNPDMEG